MSTKEGIAKTLHIIGGYGFSGVEVPYGKPYDALKSLLGKEISSSLLLRVYAEVKRQGLLDFRLSPHSTRITITPFGANRLLAHTANTISIPAMKEWDQKWRVVTYDIPKGKDKERVFLNRRLKELGFKMLNKSLWVHPYKCEEQVKYITDYLSITRFVMVFTMNEWDEVMHKNLHSIFKHTELTI